MEEDNLLIKKYLSGNQDSFKLLIDKYTSSIYSFASRFLGPIEAKDITQEVFVKVWKNLKKFDSNKSQFKTWLFTVTRNSVTDYLRKKKTIPFSKLNEDEFSIDIVDDNILPDEIIQKLQDKELLLKSIAELPDGYKTVITLYYGEDMTFKEIGEVLNKPLNTVKSYHYRALILLKNIFK